MKKPRDTVPLKNESGRGHRTTDEIEKLKGLLTCSSQACLSMAVSAGVRQGRHSSHSSSPQDAAPKKANQLAKILKGLCHEMNIFLKVLKIKSVLSIYAPIVKKKNFGCLVLENIKVKFCLAFMKTITH
jgi:hypothetical protein